MINYKTKWNLPRTFNHCISPLLKSATHNNITPQINSLKLSPTPPRPFPQFTIPFQLILRRHYAHTNEPKQITNCNQITCAGLYPTQTSPRHAITIVFPNPINATLPQTKHATNYPHVPNTPPRCHTFQTRHPVADAHPNPDAPPHREKNDAIHPRPFPQFTISFPLTDQSEQIINLGHNPPIKTLYTTNYPHVSNTPTPLRTRTSPPTPHPIRKNDATHPRPFPQFTIPFPLTDQSEQIINLGHNPPIKTLYTTNYPHVPNTPPRCGRAPQPRHPIPSEKKQRHTSAPVSAIYNTVSINLAPSLRTHKRTKTNYKLQSTAIPNQIFHKKESPRHNGGDAVLLSP